LYGLVFAAFRTKTANRGFSVTNDFAGATEGGMEQQRARWSTRGRDGVTEGGMEQQSGMEDQRAGRSTRGRDGPTEAGMEQQRPGWSNRGRDGGPDAGMEQQRAGWSNRGRDGATERKRTETEESSDKKQNSEQRVFCNNLGSPRRMSVLCAEEHRDGHRLGVWGEISPLYGLVFAAFRTKTANRGFSVTNDFAMTPLA
jgi:hypothetical protein